MSADQMNVPVTIAVAVSEGGRIRVAVTDTNWIQEEQKHKAMLDEIRNDKQLWSLRYIKTSVPYPVSREAQP